MALKQMKNGVIQSGFCPVSNRSRNTLEKAGLSMPMTDTISVVMATNAMVEPVPFSRLRENFMTLFGLPHGSKCYSGSNIIQIPVKLISNSCIGTSQAPLAGSLIMAFPPLKPHSTTK